MTQTDCDPSEWHLYGLEQSEADGMEVCPPPGRVQLVVVAASHMGSQMAR